MPVNPPHPSKARLRLLADPAYPLCRDDVVWTLNYIKKKAAGKDSALQSLSQPQLLETFRCFAEAAVLLLRSRPTGGEEFERLRPCLLETVRLIDR